MEIKGVIHVHSTYSFDGKESLASLKEFLMSQGISFCCLTEHTDQMTIEQAQMFVQECRSLSGSQFVFIPGFEVPYKDAHVLFIGSEMFFGQQADAAILAQWKERSVLTILAHPVRNRFEVDTALASAIDGIEIWNQQYDGKLVPRPRAAELLRSLQNTNHDLVATGGLDFHRREHFGAPVFKIEVGHITSSDILAALKTKSFIFGNQKITVAPTGLWRGGGSVPHNLLSYFSVGIIVCGKTVNKVLARFGWKLPKSIRQFIRSRV